MPTVRLAEPDDQDAIAGLIDDVGRALGRPPLSDHVALARENGTARLELVATGAGGQVVGYGAVVPANELDVIELVVAPDAESDPRAALLAATTRLVAGTLQWWVADPDETDRAGALAAGWSPHRTLLQMRRPLPADKPELAAGVRWTTFTDADTAALIAVNNRAFAGHEEQGGWTAETFAERRTAPWFDPAGIVLAFDQTGPDDDDADRGRLAGFCWTKIHPATAVEPVLGEIYVIGVDPSAQGRGLGRALTLAGLDSLFQRGVETGLLYVDADNTAAVAMYEQLGFHPTRRDESFLRTASAT